MDKLIISDTSCLISLSNIGLLHILKNIYAEIIITSEVQNEFGENLPDWIIVINVKDKGRQAEIEKRLDRGEASSIALALEIKHATLIIDELKGRKIAKSFDLEVIGTIGVLLIANKKGLLNDVLSVILKLVNNGFRLSDKMLDKLIEIYGSK